MLQCPNCKYATSEIQFTGPVLIATGVLEVQEGVVVTIGPVLAINTVRVGDEWKSHNLTLTCPSCKERYVQDEFRLILPCIITGEPADKQIKTNIGTFHVSAGAEAIARALFDRNTIPLYSDIGDFDV